MFFVLFATDCAGLAYKGNEPQALVSVATRFLVDIPDIQAEVRDSLSLHMAFAHLAVADASQR